MAAGSYPSPTLEAVTVIGGGSFGSLGVTGAATFGSTASFAGLVTASAGLFAPNPNVGGFGNAWGTGDITTGGSGASGTGSGRLALRYDATNNAAYIGVIAPGSAWYPLIVQAGSFSFLSAGSTQGLYQAPSGNVGIGTTSPAFPLDVSGSARVTGSLTLGTALAASSGGTGASSLSGGLDAAFATTQGTLLYRGASGWAALSPGTAGQVLGTGGSGANPTWQNAGGSGTVTSVALSLPASLFSVSGSPVTGSGTLAGALATQAPNAVLAGPATPGGANAAPTMRPLVPADDPAPADGCCRLSVASTTSLLLSPLNGNTLWIGGVACTIPSGGVTLSGQTGLSAATLYYVYATASGGIVNGLVLSPTGHVAGSDGRHYLNNAGSAVTTSRLVCMVYANTTSAPFLDSATNRWCLNYFQRRNLALSYSSTNSTASTSPVSLGGVSFLCWGDEDTSASIAGNAQNNTANTNNTIAIAIDGSTVAQTNLYLVTAGATANAAVPFVAFTGSEGQHAITALGAVGGGTMSVSLYVAATVRG